MSKRDYNKEYQDNTERKYSYDFDTILRKYMLEAVKPFISDLNSPALEMGCFKGDFTELLEKDFKNVSKRKRLPGCSQAAVFNTSRRVVFKGFLQRLRKVP